MEQRVKNGSPFSNKNRNTYVVEHITSSMLALLKEKPIEEISVRELCDMAGVGRTSFYRNFDSKEDIIRKYIQEIFRDWTDQYQAAPDLPVRELIRIIFTHFEANREFYGLLNERGLVYLLKDIILDLCYFDPDQELPVAYASSYMGFFLYGWIETWFRRGMRDKAEDLLVYLPEKQ